VAIPFQLIAGRKKFHHTDTLLVNIRQPIDPQSTAPETMAATKSARKAQSIQSSTFVKQLAANDLPTRKAAIKSLKAFISTRKEFPLFEYEKLWKGLFYAMWFSDKPRPQQYLARELGELFLDVPVAEFAKFQLAFWVIIAKDWANIDHWRLDKFLLMLRKVFFYQLKRLQIEEFSGDLVGAFVKNMEKIPLSGDQKIPHGIPFHMIDIFCDELEKVMFEELEDENDDGEEDEEQIERKKKEIINQTPIKELLQPFVTLSVESKYKPLRDGVKQNLFQDSRLEQWEIDVSKKQKHNKTEKKEQSEDEKEESENESENESEDTEDEWNGF
jgi:ribosomal RNA-processing protein 1